MERVVWGVYAVLVEFAPFSFDCLAHREVLPAMAPLIDCESLKLIEGLAHLSSSHYPF